MSDDAHAFPATETVQTAEEPPLVPAPASEDVDSAESDTADEALPGRKLFSTAAVGAALFGLGGLFLGLVLLSLAVAPHILQPDGPGYQEIAPHLPIPRLLDWDHSYFPVFQQLGSVASPLTTLLGLGLVVMAARFVLYCFCPQFVLFTPAQDGALRAGGALHAHLDSRRLLRFIALAAVVAVPTFGIVMAGIGRPSAVAWPASLSAAGALAFFGLHRRGPGGSWLAANGRGATSRGAAGAACAGALFGLSLAGIRRIIAPEPLTSTLLRFHTLGTFNLAHLNWVLRAYGTAALLAGAATGVLVAVFACRRGALGIRIILLMLAVGLSVTGRLALAPLSRISMEHRFDTDRALMALIPPYDPHRSVASVPDGEAPAALLFLRAALAACAPPSATIGDFAYYSRMGPIALHGTGFTEDGLTVDPASRPRVENYLRSHPDGSALSWTATKHLFNVGAVAFDATAAMDACLRDLEKTPHMGQCSGTLRQMLFTCSASPANQAILGRWADPAAFTVDDREGRKMMGDLFMRMGMSDRALKWYREAEMPRTFLSRIEKDRPVFHSGVVTGRLMLHGLPLSGANVGVAPKRLNGLPRDMEVVVLRADRELMAVQPYSESFPAFTPRPYALRWISASSPTDAQGRFRIENLTEGEYRLVCRLPASVPLTVPDDERLRVAGAPGPFEVNYGKPAVDLGAIAIGN